MSEPRLFVAWKIPPDLEEADLVLSFLPPDDEQALARRSVRVECGRRLADELRARAVEIFADICVRAGTAGAGGGRTLRSALRRRPGECSDWWFHSLSFRIAGDYDRTLFEAVLTALTVDRWACMHEARALRLHGASDVLEQALASKYRIVKATGSWRSEEDSILACWWRGARERLWAIGWASQMRKRARTSTPPRSEAIRLRLHRGGSRLPLRSTPPVVALTGHPWLRWDREARTFVDGHFKGLPEALARCGFRTVRLLWYLTDQRPVDSPLAATDAYARDEAVALQAFITRRDILRELLSTRVVRVYLSWVARVSFRAAFRVEDLDLFALFRRPLLRGFLGAQIPLSRLGAIATARACDAVRPVATICHFEWIGDARPHYDGVRRATHRPLATAVQHSSNTSALLYGIDAASELRGEPDGCPLPHASHVFAMGAAGLARFRASGYQPHELSLVGSTRFDLATLRDAVHARRRARTLDARTPDAPGPALRVLVLPSSVRRDAELIQAAYTAADGLASVEVFVRSKPGRRQRLPGASPDAASRIQFTDGSLADDLAAADVVLFSASGAADEAYACGVPAWQWLALNLEGDTLADVSRIPRFSSIDALRTALAAAARDRRSLAPPAADVAHVVAQLFGPADGHEADRIAERLRSLLVPDTHSHPTAVRGPQPGVVA